MGIRRFWDQHLGCRLDKPSKGADLGGNTGDLHIHISITEDVRKSLIVFRARALRAQGLLLADDAPQWSGGRLFGASAGFLLQTRP